MTITTHPRIWMHGALLPFVHEANQQIEYVAGDWAGSLSVAWDLVEGRGAPSLAVQISDATHHHKPLTMSRVSDVVELVRRVQYWRANRSA